MNAPTSNHSTQKGSFLAWGALALVVALIVVFGALKKPAEQTQPEAEKPVAVAPSPNAKAAEPVAVAPTPSAKAAEPDAVA